MNVWTTKNVFTQGVREAEVNVPDFSNVAIGKYNETYLGEGVEWHRTRELALQYAEQMKQNRIASLEKQIEKLKKLKFDFRL